MSELVADCPRCNSQKITFDILSGCPITGGPDLMLSFEIFGVCRRCHLSTIFNVKASNPGASVFLSQNGIATIKGNLNDYISKISNVSIKDNFSIEPPAFLPKDIENIFNEAATCIKVDCYNAAATMFRLCIDAATRSLIPIDEKPEPSRKIKENLNTRLNWMFENSILPKDLKQLADSIRLDGNDGAHIGNLAEEDAEDLQDFTKLLLERIYTEKQRIVEAEKRRTARRQQHKQKSEGK